MKRATRILSTIVFALFLISQSGAEVFKWVDEKGSVHFTEDPSTIPEKYKDSVKSRTMEESRPSAAPASVPAPRRQRNTPQQQLNEPASMPKRVEKEEVETPSPGSIPFEKFKYLQEGMSEAEVLSRFGSPTRVEADEAKTSGTVSGGTISGQVSPGGSVTGTLSGGSYSGETVVIKRYYYIGDHSRGEKTTIIHIRKGKVFKYERI